MTHSYTNFSISCVHSMLLTAGWSKLDVFRGQMFDASQCRLGKSKAYGIWVFSTRNHEGDRMKLVPSPSDQKRKNYGQNKNYPNFSNWFFEKKYAKMLRPLKSDSIFIIYVKFPIFWYIKPCATRSLTGDWPKNKKKCEIFDFFVICARKALWHSLKKENVQNLT